MNELPITDRTRKHEVVASLLCALVLAACGNSVSSEPDLAEVDLSVADTAVQPDGALPDLAGADLALITDPCLQPNVGTGIQLASSQIVTHALQPFAVEPFGTSTVYTASATTITVFFTTLVDVGDAQTLANYTTGGALTISSAVATNYKVVLTTQAQTPGQAFTLTVSNVRDLAQTHTMTTTAIPLTGYRFGANVPSPASTLPKTVPLFFSNDSIACAAVTNPANYTMPGYVIVSAQTYTACTTRAQSVELRLDHGLTPGPHPLSFSANLTDQLGAPLSPATVQIEGPSRSDALYLTDITPSSASNADATFNTDVDSSTGMLAAHYTLDPPTTLSAPMVGAGSSGNFVSFTATTTANQLYTLSVSDVLPKGGATVSAIRPWSFYGYGSFYPTAVLPSSAGTVLVIFSQQPAANANDVTKYVFSGGLAATNAVVSGVGVTLTVPNMVAGTNYTLDLSALSSMGSVAMSSGYSGMLDVKLSAAIDTDALPKLSFAGQDLGLDYYLSVSPDKKHLYVQTPLLPKGVYSVKMCGLRDAAHTSFIGTTQVPLVVP